MFRWIYLGRWALTFAVLTVIAGLIGFTGVAGEFATAARVVFYVLLGLSVVALIAKTRTPKI